MQERLCDTHRVYEEEKIRRQLLLDQDVELDIDDVDFEDQHRMAVTSAETNLLQAEGARELPRDACIINGVPVASPVASSSSVGSSQEAAPPIDELVDSLDYLMDVSKPLLLDGTSFTVTGNMFDSNILPGVSDHKVDAGQTRRLI